MLSYSSGVTRMDGIVDISLGGCESLTLTAAWIFPGDFMKPVGAYLQHMAGSHGSLRAVQPSPLPITWGQLRWMCGPRRPPPLPLPPQRAWYLLVCLTLKQRSWHAGPDFPVWTEIIRQRKEQSAPALVAANLGAAGEKGWRDESVMMGASLEWWRDFLPRGRKIYWHCLCVVL